MYESKFNILSDTAVSKEESRQKMKIREWMTYRSSYNASKSQFDH